MIGAGAAGVAVPSLSDSLTGYCSRVADDQGIDGAFRHILDAISDGVYVAGPDRTIVYWSAGAERITGYTADEVVGHRCDEEILVHTDLGGTRLCVPAAPFRTASHRRERSIRPGRARRSRARGRGHVPAKHRGRDEFETSRGGESR